MFEITQRSESKPYGLFTTVGSRLVVPPGSDMDRHIQFHWENGYELLTTKESIFLTLPIATIIVYPPEACIPPVESALTAVRVQIVKDAKK
jgi:hypothetical protein